MPTSEQIESFTRFAREQVHRRGEDLGLDELFDEWRILNPPSDDWLAVRASIRDMERGEMGRTFDDFAAEFRQRRNIPEPA